MMMKAAYPTSRSCAVPFAISRALRLGGPLDDDADDDGDDFGLQLGGGPRVQTSCSCSYPVRGQISRL